MASPAKTLPASWYCSKPLYDLERRAVFEKASPLHKKIIIKRGLGIGEADCGANLLSDQGWYLLGPVTRFKGQEQVGYEVAGVRLQVEHVEDGFRISRQPDVRYGASELLLRARGLQNLGTTPSSQADAERAALRSRLTRSTIL